MYCIGCLALTQEQRNTSLGTILESDKIFALFSLERRYTEEIAGIVFKVYKGIYMNICQDVLTQMVGAVD